MELINGTAYVAVEPPDSFVQSGYEKYLIKATRHAFILDLFFTVLNSCQTNQHLESW